jgi:DNA-binding transcriptional LysR family regulator
MMPAEIAGVGFAVLPEFILRDALDAGQLERLFDDWTLPAAGVYWVTPPGGLRPKRVEVLAVFLFDRLGPKKIGDEDISRERASNQAKR